MNIIKDSFDKMRFSLICNVRNVLSIYKSGSILIAVKHEMKHHWKPIRRRTEASISLQFEKLCLGL